MSESIGVVVLAAGAASRFGSPKQVATLHGRSLLDIAHLTIRGLAEHLGRFNPALQCCSVLVLGGHKQAIDQVLDARQWNVVCENKNWQQGMASSLLTGFEACLAYEQGLKGVLVLLVDQPLIRHEDLQRLVQQGLVREQIVGARYADSVGPPVYFPSFEVRTYMQDYAKLGLSEKEKGAKSFILQRPHSVVDVIGVADDIDTPDDLVRVQEQYLNGH